jgi:hypothetical protein
VPLSLKLRRVGPSIAFVPPSGVLATVLCFPRHLQDRPLAQTRLSEIADTNQISVKEIIDCLSCPLSWVLGFRDAG